MAQIVTKTGENTITFDAYYQFMWCINYGDTDVYVSNHNNIVAGDDDVIYLPAGAAVRVNVNGKTLYVLGSTTLEVHAQNYSTEPIASTAGGGGGSITIDPTPTQGSSNAVSSGGVYTALQNVPRPIDYSTTEQNTGRKWIDGKPIYSKTIVKTAVGEYANEIPANIDTVINAESIIHYDGGGQNITIPVYATNSSDYYNFYIKNKTTLVIRDPTIGMTNIKVVITIYYTKTTDTVSEE